MGGGRTNLYLVFIVVVFHLRYHMVLQNKYKARASRRYNAARGGATDGRGRGGKGRGRGGGHRFDATSFPSLPGQEEGGEDEEVDDDKDSEDDEEEEERTRRAKYAPRKLQSNAWRYADPAQDENEEEAEAQSEDEVDLSGLLERVAKLDSSRTSKTMRLSEDVALEELEGEANDVDVSLLHLLAKRRIDSAQADNSSSHQLSDEQIRQLEEEGKRLLEEKARQEKHERRARILKQSAKSISVNIGDSRNEKRSQGFPSSRDKIRSRDANLAYIYDEDGEDVKAERTDDADAILNELLDNSTKDTGFKSTMPSAAARNQHTMNHSNGSKRADEDFLDTIL